MRNSLGIASMFMFSAAMMQNDVAYGKMASQSRLSLKQKPVEVVQPKNTKHYFFDMDGNFNNEGMKKDECVFDCFSVNDKNAIRKFKNHLKY